MASALAKVYNSKLWWIQALERGFFLQHRQRQQAETGFGRIRTGNNSTHSRSFCKNWYQCYPSSMKKGHILRFSVLGSQGTHRTSSLHVFVDITVANAAVTEGKSGVVVFVGPCPFFVLFCCFGDETQVWLGDLRVVLLRGGDGFCDLICLILVQANCAFVPLLSPLMSLSGPCHRAFTANPEEKKGTHRTSSKMLMQLGTQGGPSLEFLH